ncbi:MAG: WG repeat-containing protein, partial [Synergistaceae bacterium]|nr:WG repeat-containing protein [Synergistaceae bacterium]
MKKTLKTLLLTILFLWGAIFVSWADSEEKFQKEYEWLVYPKYEMARRFSDGLWCVQKNGLWGYVDSADKVIVDFQCIDATSFRDGIAFVRTGRMNIFAWGLIDKQGRYL